MEMSCQLDETSLMSQPQTLASYGPYYDLIYSWKNYEAEAKAVMALIKKHKTSSGNDLLDVACGTGKHMEQFTKSLKCSGIDLSKDMLRTARKRLPKVLFKRADMRTFDLGKKFDVITCLFSAIGHLHTTADLRKPCTAFSRI